MKEIPTDGKIDSLLEERIAAGDFPSAVYLVASDGVPVFGGALGYAVKEPDERPATMETIYDLASLTKPLVTGLLCAELVQRGLVTLEDKLSATLPEFERAEHQEITVRHLLTHTSGLPAWRPLSLLTGGRSETVIEAMAKEPLESKPGTRVLYSDLGFIALGSLLERTAGGPLAELARASIFEPLGLRRTFFNPDAALRDEIAASELGNTYERRMSIERGEEGDGNWREELVWGEVHDGNAYFLGGAAGHAGLFSDARETLLIATQFMAEYSTLLAPETCALFRLDMTPGLEEARSFAWQLAATAESTAGAALSPDSFGHTGFTGTSCWTDPERRRTFILLTNRTHAHALPFTNINGVRRQFHTLASATLDAMERQS